MAETQIKDLLERVSTSVTRAAVGTRRCAKYIFAARNGIHIIDLKKTLQRCWMRSARCAKSRCRVSACVRVHEASIATDRRAGCCACGAFFVTERWLAHADQFLDHEEADSSLKELERGIDEGAYEFYTKKEQLLLSPRAREAEQVPGWREGYGAAAGALFVVDAKKESIALQEANKLGIPVIAIADTNAILT